MPKFLIKVAYTAEGTRGLMKEGGSSRRAAIQKLIEDRGGRLEAFYFAYGEDDALLIVDVPDSSSGLALTLAVNASGAARLSTVPLLTPEDVDAAAKISVSYRPPGS
jgi:uncharacterized protein with GYD domain